MDIEEKYKILKGIAECVPENGSGEDEEEGVLLQNFLPLRSYSKLADQKVFLITGGRGAGKTELFRILTSCDGLDHVISENDRRRYKWTEKSEFLVGYIATGAEAKAFPVASVCTDLLRKEKPDNLGSFWGGLACSVILRRFKDDVEINALAEEYLGKQLKENFIKRSNELSAWWGIADLDKEKWESFLDKTDDILNRRKLCIFITYDELDRICSNYDGLFLFIRGLLDFWYLHNSRFANIKGKIFLRSDLYNAKALRFVDASKMGAYRIELNWNITSLYRMFVKRLANTGIRELESYLNGISGLISENPKGMLGYLPCDTEGEYRLLVEKMIGKYMGKTPKRGKSYDWVPNHIQDANAEMAPRSFLKCFAIAAESMLNHKQELEGLEGDRLLSPTGLQGALEKVSADRVEELTREEYPWLQNLINRLYGKTMLMGEKEFLGYLSPNDWPERERDELPGKTGLEILEALLLLGIVMRTTDGRINVPEIYLRGFGLKRKGGIKRPKQSE